MHDNTNIRVWLTTACVAFALGCEGQLGVDGEIGGLHGTTDPTLPGPGDTVDDIVDGPVDPTDPTLVDGERCATETPQPVADVPTRIVTSQELNNALATLFPTLDIERVEMTYDSRVGSFVTNSREDVTTQHVRDFRLVAEDVAIQVQDNVEDIAPCAGEGDVRACAADAVEALATAAFRRPLEPAEQDGLMALYDAGNEDAGHAGGMRFVTEAILQTPSFIYVTEAATNQPAALNDWEIAQRMAALLSRSIPDSLLLEAAGNGQLVNAEVREAHARRMLRGPLGQQMMRALVQQWLGLDRIDEQAFAQQEDNFELVDAMTAESTRMIDHVFEEENASWKALITTNTYFVDETLAEHYGIDLADATELRPGVYEVESDVRAGLLGTANFLALAHGPVHRGLTIRQALLCGNVPGPDGIDTDAIATEPEESERSKTEKRLDHNTCGGCHAMMDPLGLPYETFDDLGRYRTEDQYGNAVESTGEILATRDANGAVADSVELVNELVDSEQVRECVARNLFVWAFAREMREADACTVSRIEDALADNQDDLREALVSIVADDMFIQAVNTTEDTP